MSRTNRVLTGALATMTAAAGLTFAFASPASASTPSGCSSVRQIGTTRVLKVNGQNAASVKQ
jgi:hypothetical protein